MDKEMDIKAVESIRREVGKIFTYLSKNEIEDPFFEWPSYQIAAIQKDLDQILDYYLYFLEEYHDGNLYSGERTVSDTTTAKGSKAPAFKKNINVELIYALWKRGDSVREIARQANCSTGTVKSRILERQRQIKSGEKFNFDTNQMFDNAPFK